MISTKITIVLSLNKALSFSVELQNKAIFGQSEPIDISFAEFVPTKWDL